MPPTKKNDLDLFEQIEQDIPTNNEVEKKETSQISKVTDNQIKDISKAVASGYGFDSDIEGFDIIAISMQKGGVNMKQNGNKSNRNKVNIPFKYGGKDILTSKVNGYILNTLPNYKIRQVARALATSIFKRSKIYGEEGFLLKQLNENYKKQWEAIKDPNKNYWATDFQHMNEDCPEAIREILKLRYQDRYTPEAKRSYNNNLYK
jgi:hypothetical protein